jgi:hypothetical protein
MGRGGRPVRLGFTKSFREFSLREYPANKAVLQFVVGLARVRAAEQYDKFTSETSKSRKSMSGSKSESIGDRE